MKEETYLTGIYSLKAYTVGELEMKLAQRFGGQAYEAVLYFLHHIQHLCKALTMIPFLRINQE